MSAVLKETLENIGKAVHELRQDNDKSLDALKQGNDVKFRELQEKCDRQESHITDLIKARNDMNRQMELAKERVELLESLADRPKGNILVKLTNEDEQLFIKQLRSGFNDREAKIARDQLQQKALELKVDTVTAGTALLGGNAVPKIISDQIDKLILKLSGVADAIGSKTVGTTDYNRPLTISGQAGGWAAEAGSRSQGNAPNVRNCKPTWGELYSYLFAYKEAMQDVMFDVQAWLVSDTADSQAKLLSTAIYNGNGSGKPTGMTNTTPVTTADYASPMRAAAAYQFVSHNGVDTSSPNRLTLDILLSAVYALAPGYRSNAKFAMNSVTQGIARRLKDTTNQYLWQPSVQAGQPDLLFGYPVFTWEDLADGNTVDGFVAAFGEWSRAYELTNRGPLEIVLDNQITTPGTYKFYISRRWGGIPYNNDALKFVRNAD